MHSRMIAYFSEWTDKNGVSHHTVDNWDDVLKWNWDLVKDFKIEGMSYPSVALNTALSKPRFIVDKDGTDYYVVDTRTHKDIGVFDSYAEANECVMWHSSIHA